MSQKTAKLLRRIADLTGKTDSYIKKEFKQMTPTVRSAYLAFMRENFFRIKQFKETTSEQTDTVVLDQKLPVE